MRHKSYQTTQRYINMARQIDGAVENLHVPDVLKSKMADSPMEGYWRDCSLATTNRPIYWAQQDSNLQPRDYESPALPLSYRP